MADSAYNILTGVGELWVAPAWTTMPTLDQVPSQASSLWKYVGPSDGGVKVDFDETINEFSPDTETGSVEAIRSAESAMISANLFEATLESLALVMAQNVSEVEAGTGTTGYKEIGMSRGAKVTKKAFLFRANSPYGDFPGQYYVPIGFLSGKVGMEYTKEGKVVVPVEFHALVDKNADHASRKFGRVQYGHQSAT